MARRSTINDTQVPQRIINDSVLNFWAINSDTRKNAICIIIHNIIWRQKGEKKDLLFVIHIIDEKKIFYFTVSLTRPLLFRYWKQIMPGLKTKRYFS